ncbi:MAG: diguanylate cyclase [Spirochaetales bacterium]|nr:diguanylate cyclase [Spirochaetales bacterium]
MVKMVKGLSILLIEDNYDDIEHIKNILKESNYKNAGLSIAFSLKDGISILKKENIGIILMDLNVPDSSGLSSFQKLIHDYYRIPVVALTNYNDEKLGSEAIRMGAQDYLMKGDINLKSLANTIQFSIERHKQKIKTNELNHFLKNNLDYLNKLIEFSKKINTKLDFNSIFNTLKNYIQPLFLSELFSLFLLDGAKEQLQLLGHNHPEWVGTEHTTIDIQNNGIMWDAIQKRETISIENFSKTQYKKRKQEKYKNERVLIVPLITENKVVGVLNLNNIFYPVIDSRLLTKIKNAIEYLANALHNYLQYSNTELLSVTDDLTGLFNHRYILWQLDKAIQTARREGTPLSILLADVHTISHVNDVYGHNTGDNVLRWAAQTLTSTAGQTSMTGRFYGTQFIMLFPGKSIEQSKQIAENIQKAVDSAPFKIKKGSILSIPLKMGITAFNPRITDSKNLIVNAQAALKEIKKAGAKNIAVHEDTLPEGEAEADAVKIFFVDPLQAISVVMDTLIKMSFECYAVSHNDMWKLPKIFEEKPRYVIFLCVTHPNEIPKSLKFIQSIQQYRQFKIQIGAFVYNKIDMNARRLFLEQNVAVIQFADIQENTLLVLKKILLFFEAKGKRGNIRVKASRDCDALFNFGQNTIIKAAVIEVSISSFTCRIEDKNRMVFHEGAVFDNIMLVLKGIRLQVAGKLLGFDKSDPYVAIIQILSAISENHETHYVAHLPESLKNKLHNYIKMALKDEIQTKLERVTAPDPAS